jgi:hypothetical protein
VADIGGGQGSTLAAILHANPSVRGVLVDQPQVVAGAEPVLQAAGVADRCEVLDGDVLQGIPRGADAYVVKRILMIWATNRRSKFYVTALRLFLAISAGGS